MLRVLRPVFVSLAGDKLKEEFKEITTAVIKYAFLLILAVIAIILALVFFNVLVFIYLSSKFGYLVSALIIFTIWIVLAIMGLALAKRFYKSSPLPFVSHKKEQQELDKNSLKNAKVSGNYEDNKFLDKIKSDKSENKDSNMFFRGKAVTGRPMGSEQSFLSSKKPQKPNGFIGKIGHYGSKAWDKWGDKIMSDVNTPLGPVSKSRIISQAFKHRDIWVPIALSAIPILRNRKILTAVGGLVLGTAVSKYFADKNSDKENH